MKQMCLLRERVHQMAFCDPLTLRPTAFMMLSVNGEKAIFKYKIV